MLACEPDTKTAPGLAEHRFARVMDITGAMLAAIFVLPAMIPIGLAIFLEDGWPILYRQKRVGRGGKLFQILKFRTMRTNANGSLITAAGDSRTTRVGDVLRRFKLDELPQFLCVLRGDMSLIGPRPEVPEYVDLRNYFWKTVLQSRPGITDLASLAYRDEEQLLALVHDADAYYRARILPEKLRLNIEYQQGRTLRRDCRLMWLTARYSFFPNGFDRRRIIDSFNR